MFRYLSCINCSTISSGHTATEEASLVKRKILRYLYKQTDQKKCWRGGNSLFRYKCGQIVGISDRLSSPLLFHTSSFYYFIFYYFFLPTHHFAPLSTGCKIILRRTNYGLQWRTKTLGTVMKNLPSTSLTYQMFRCSIICTSLTTWIPRLALPSPLQTMLG